MGELECLEGEARPLQWVKASSQCLSQSSLVPASSSAASDSEGGGNGGKGSSDCNGTGKNDDYKRRSEHRPTSGVHAANLAKNKRQAQMSFVNWLTLRSGNWITWMSVMQSPFFTCTGQSTSRDLGIHFRYVHGAPGTDEELPAIE